MIVTTITVRLNEEETKLYQEYAKLNGVPLSTLFKQTLEEKIETELDLQAIQEYEKENTHETYSHEDLKKRLGL
jgi:predicted transcriptional regulator